MSERSYHGATSRSPQYGEVYLLTRRFRADWWNKHPDTASLSSIRSSEQVGIVVSVNISTANIITVNDFIFVGINVCNFFQISKFVINYFCKSLET